MDKTQRAEIEKKLLTEIKYTQEKINKYTGLCKPIAPENAIGRVSRMDAINNKSVVEAALREAKKKMQQLRMMGKKINAIDFGICLGCQQKIPFGRLMVLPESKFCIHCAK